MEPAQNIRVWDPSKPEDTLPLTAQECRAKALECDDRAAETRDFGVKIQYQQLAERWHSLADQLERDEQVERVEQAGSVWSAKSARRSTPQGR
jgi:hypothetical protein